MFPRKWYVLQIVDAKVSCRNDLKLQRKTYAIIKNNTLVQW